MSSKIFIIGLPRTGTTSICNSFLQLGYKTAHTAYTQQAIITADVIADTPVFSEYALLDSTLQIAALSTLSAIYLSGYHRLGNY